MKSLLSVLPMKRLYLEYSMTYFVCSFNNLCFYSLNSCGKWYIILIHRLEFLFCRAQQ